MVALKNVSLCREQYHDINVLIIFNIQHVNISHGNYCLLLVPNCQPHYKSFVSYWMAKTVAEAVDGPIL
jgi:hypothetical protein